MQGSLAGRLAVLAALFAAPLAASEVYIPLLNPLANDGSHSDVQVWLSNPGAAQASFATATIAAGADGTQRGSTPTRTPVLPGQSFELIGLQQVDKVGMLALDLGTGLTADARMVTTAPSGSQVSTPVPVISSANEIAAGTKAELLALDRDPASGKVLDFGVVNLARAAAQCQVTFFASDGGAIGSATTISMPPLSIAHYHDAFGILGFGRVAALRGEVTCNQPFFTYAALYQWPTSQYLFITPGATQGVSGNGGGGPPPPTGNSIVFTKPGLFHSATISNPKGTVDVTVPGALTLRELILDLDVTAGPWNRDKIPGAHNLIWLYRGKFRGNTVANVNAFGPNRYTFKINQNIDLPAGANTASEVPFTFQQGTKYHLHYVYDAQKTVITATLSSGGTDLKTMSFSGSDAGGVLTVPATGMVAEFGNYFGQAGPEVASPGWDYSDLRIEMVPN